MKPPQMREVAQRDYQEALERYAEQSEDLARRFDAEVARTLDLIQRFPGIGSWAPEVDDPDVKRFPVHNFPYHVVFLPLPTGIEILAVAHRNRKPGYWTLGA